MVRSSALGKESCRGSSLEISKDGVCGVVVVVSSGNHAVAWRRNADVSVVVLLFWFVSWLVSMMGEGISASLDVSLGCGGCAWVGVVGGGVDNVGGVGRVRAYGLLMTVSRLACVFSDRMELLWVVACCLSL